MKVGPAASPATSRSVGRVWIAWLALPPAVCLLVYWVGLNTGFLMDDFAWLGLRLEIYKPSDILGVLLSPRAQGTVRVLSERVFFVVFSQLFGLDPLPFKLWMFATQCGTLVLMSLVTRRLTGSRVTAIAAPLIWTFHASLTTPLSWTSGYNYVLWGFCLLAAFYSFLRYLESGGRKWMVMQWAAYLAGFGALELTVVYPALVLLYCACCARDRWRMAIPLFVPAVVFTALHFTLIPKTGDALYRMYFDASLLATFGDYVAQGFGPSGMGAVVGNHWATTGYIITVAGAGALTWFVALRIWQRDWRPLFLLGWFVITLAPVLPLKNHRSDYYLMVPVMGLAMLAAWAFGRAWQVHRLARIAALVITASYCAAMNAETQTLLAWRYQHSERLQAVLETVAATCRLHPAAIVLLDGVDPDLYSSGFNDQPFRMYGIPKVFLVPGAAQMLRERAPNLRGLEAYTIAAADAAGALDRKKALVLKVSRNRVQNITEVYRQELRVEYDPRDQRRVDVGVPGAGDRLGPEWYSAENGFRWMPASATVRLAGPRKPGASLHLVGFAPAVLFANGGPIVSARVAEAWLGSERLTKPGEQFSLEFPLPSSLVGRSDVEIKVAVDKTLAAADGRKLGLIFGVFEIR